MEDPLKILEELLAQAKDFNFQNFSTKSDYGFPDALSPNWIAMTTRITSVINKLFGDRSAVSELLWNAKKIQLIGNGENKFVQARACYIAALENAIVVLQNDTFGELIERTNAIAPHDLSNKAFVVHGHDLTSKNELETLLTEMGMEPVVLHRQADEGNTIIEKFEQHADVGFAFILLTPDEVAYLASEAEIPEADRKTEYRARPNVIFEFGYFVGKIGRNRTCALYRGETTLPSDLNGLLYKKFSSSVEEVAYAIQKELKAAGYQLA